MKLMVTKGGTSKIFQVFIQDSSSLTGAGLTGLLFSTTGLTAYYHRDTDGAATAIALLTMTVGTFTSSGFKEIDATNMPGWYQLCVPNAAFASGAESVGVHLKGATNMAPLALEIYLTGPDLTVATNMGLSALPTANPGAANGVFIAGANAATSANITGNVTGNLSGSVGTVTAAVTGTYKLKKNTALANFQFPMFDSTNHNPATGLAVTGQVSKDGAAFGNLTNAVAELASGIYQVNLAAGDVNADTLTLKFTAAASDTQFIFIITQS